jgi:CRISPR-associated protein Cmr2
MTAHLLAMSIGPVQEFIAAARRTRDLWFGSHLLSEISKAAANAVQDRGELIFPAPASQADLHAGSTLNVANVVLAKLPDADPKNVAQETKLAVKNRWRQFADEVFNEHKSVIQADIWQDQVDDVIEFYAAWIPVGDGENYQNAPSQVMRLLSARKACRDFEQAKGRQGVPKSSLDGLRESVLTDPKLNPWPAHLRRRLRLRPGEQLDVVGLVKRTADGRRRYPSVSRVAADPWIRGVPVERLKPLIAQCDRLGPDIIHKLNAYDDGRAHYAAFPYEGTAVYASRHREPLEELDVEASEIRPLTDALREITRRHGEPDRYLAVLVADGDRVGQALSALNTDDEHSRFSQSLSRFAGEAHRIVAEHFGVLVYAGGDDVLAFVPVDTCLACARGLHTEFGKMLAEWSHKTAQSLTLSVGLSIAHFLEPLEDLREYARAAEQHAKNPRSSDGPQDARNGLAVHLLKRGGGPIAVRANWTDELDGRLVELANHLNNGAIPNRVAADLHQVARVYERWPPETVQVAIRRDTLRAIASKQPRGVTAIERIRDLVNTKVKDAASLRRLADELLVARQIASAIRQAEGNAASAEVTQ